jgi:hypothetical protein
MMGTLVPETCWGNKAAYFVASSWFFTFTVSTMHGHRNIKYFNMLYMYLLYFGILINSLDCYESISLRGCIAIVFLYIFKHLALEYFF